MWCNSFKHALLPALSGVKVKASVDFKTLSWVTLTNVVPQHALDRHWKMNPINRQKYPSLMLLETASVWLFALFCHFIALHDAKMPQMLFYICVHRGWDSFFYFMNKCIKLTIVFRKDALYWSKLRVKTFIMLQKLYFRWITFFFYFLFINES